VRDLSESGSEGGNHAAEGRGFGEGKRDIVARSPKELGKLLPEALD